MPDPILVPDPSTLLPEDLVRRVRKEVPAAEAFGRLTPIQLSIMEEQGWLRLLIPASVGGLEYALPDLLAVQEAASWMDGSFGWVLALCGGAGFFAGFIEENLARTLFDRADICVAGTGFPGGRAEIVPGGYQVSGHWRYASGAPHARLFTANCLVSEGRAPIRAVIFLPEQVRLEDGWQSLGLRATASQDMIVEDVFIPHNRTFSLDTPFSHARGPLYRYPFHQQAEAVLSVTLLGMTRHFLDLFQDRILPKYGRSSGVVLQDHIEKALADLDRARLRLYTAVRASWVSYVRGLEASPRQLGEVGKVALEATRVALACSDGLYPFGGMEMMQVNTDINRVWRDIHTASQHILLAPLKREG
jgi:indole-3-acetate monooxygenase